MKGRNVPEELVERQERLEAELAVLRNNAGK
jgi:hypothetical protein